MSAIRAVIFDLDGVLALTDELHWESWRELAAENNIPFTRATFDAHMRGRQRLDALGEMLRAARRRRTPERRQALADRKNEIYLQLAAERGLEPAPGVVPLLDDLRRRGVRLAVASSSLNARHVLSAARIDRYFETVIDGSQAAGKPAPDLFLKAAAALGVDPPRCVVVEDAADGVEAARRAGMAAVAIGPRERFPPDTPRVERIDQLTADTLLAPPCR